MGEWVSILTNNKSSVVWVGVSVVLEWGSLVVWNIPSAVDTVGVVGSDWMVSWVRVAREWIVGIVVGGSMVSMGIVVVWDAIIVVIILLSLASWGIGLACRLLLLLLSMLLIVVELSVLSKIWVTEVWSEASVSPWVGIAWVSSIAWVSTISTSCSIGTSTIVSWISTISMLKWHGLMVTVSVHLLSLIRVV